LPALPNLSYREPLTASAWSGAPNRYGTSDPCRMIPFTRPGSTAAPSSSPNNSLLATLRAFTMSRQGWSSISIMDGFAFGDGRPRSDARSSRASLSLRPASAGFFSLSVDFPDSSKQTNPQNALDFQNPFKLSQTCSDTLDRMSERRWGRMKSDSGQRLASWSLG
jgi:hypothetical protein